MLEIPSEIRYNLVQYNKKEMESKREEVFCVEILLTIVFVFVGIGAFAFGMEHMNFPDLGIIVETAVIGGVILWRMRKNNKK